MFLNVNSETFACVLIFLVSLLSCYLLCFPVRKLGLKIGAVVPPGEGRIHKYPLPDIGGVAMVAAFLIAILISSILPGFSAIFLDPRQVLGVVIAVGVIFVVGAVDDRIDMSAPAKTAGEILAAMILYFFGVTMFWFKIPFGSVIYLSRSIQPLVTAIWVFAITNATNLIDGLDGLASGVIAIASGAFCVYSLRLIFLGPVDPSSLGPMIAAITCGICVGFLPHNFHPEKIIMGDSGALSLGLMMSVATMVVGGRTVDVSGDTFFFFAPLFIPFFILGVPLLDMTFAILRRATNRKGVAERDIDHLHHRLLRLGHGQRRAVGILWVWTALLSGVVLYPTFKPHSNEIVPLVVAIIVASLYTWFKPGLGREGGKSDEETKPQLENV